MSWWENDFYLYLVFLICFVVLGLTWAWPESRAWARAHPFQAAIGFSLLAFPWFAGAILGFGSIILLFIGIPIILYNEGKKRRARAAYRFQDSSTH